MTFCFDIDGTLCTNTDGHYLDSQPFPDVIERINGLYETGHRILLYTARGSTTGIDWRDVTERQMVEWGVKYHDLHLGKPTADVYIDDKAININDWKR
jgi:ribonucleotide monophosphatase NagD (HAD superfamily)